MSKKMMVLAMAVACAALFALPAVASAQSWHLDQTTSFTVSGSGGNLTGVAAVTCTGTTGEGKFSTTTEGTVTLNFSSCRDGVFNLPCQNGATSGVITTTASFDGIMVNSTASTKDAGVLLTPDTSIFPTSTSSDSELKSTKRFSEFTCNVGLSIKIFGTGVIGTLNPSGPNVCSAGALSEASLVFTSSANGVQADQTWTGNNYDLKQENASHSTASLDGTGTLKFPAARTTTCT